MSTATESPATPQAPSSGISHFEKNVADVLAQFASFIPFRHEGEYTRIMTAISNLGTDLEELLKNPEPVAPGQTAPDPALAAVIQRVNDQDSKLNQILDLLSAKAADTPADTPSTDPTENPPAS